jgi:hypothetical protein
MLPNGGYRAEIGHAKASAKANGSKQSRVMEQMVNKITM